MKIEILLLSALAVFASCKKDSPVNWDEIDSSSQSESCITKDATPFSSGLVSWMVNENSTVASDMQSRIGGEICDAAYGELIFVDRQSLKSNSAVIADCYKDGAIIIVVNPDPAELEEFMTDYGIVQVVPSGDNPVSLYAFSWKGAYTVIAIGDAVQCEPTLTEPVSGAEQLVEYTEEDARDTQALPTDGLDFADIGWYVKPFVDWVNLTSRSNGSELEGVATYNCQYTYNLDLKVHKCAGSHEDRIKGPFTVFAHYSYRPVYVYPDQSYSPGDYYSFNATYGCETGQIFYGDDFVNKHGGIRVHITGAFLRYLDVRTYIDGDGDSPQFLASHEPIPASDIDTKNYSETKGWNIGGGVTANFGKQNGHPLDTKSASFNWGYNHSNTVSYAVSDLAVKNDYQNNYSGHGASPAWSFICQNLPAPKGDKGFNGKTPVIAKSTLSCGATWIWHTASHSAGDTLAIGELYTKFSPQLGAVHNGLCVAGEKNYYTLDEIELHNTFVVPFRIPFGTVRINNSFKNGEVLSDISVCRTTDGKEMYHSKGDFSSTKPCMFSVAEGSYEVTMKVTDRTGAGKKYRMNDLLEVTRRTEEADIQDIDSFIRFTEEQ